jgi:hypothetical protein
MKEVAAAQHGIRWHHILKGRYSKQWKAIQDKHLGVNKRVNGSSWMMNIIQAWFTDWLRLWTIQNEDRHGQDQATKLQAENYANFNNSLQLTMEEYITDSMGCLRNQSPTNWNGTQEVLSCGSTPGNQS